MERYQSGIRFSVKVFLRLTSSFFCFRLVLQFNLLVHLNVCCPNASDVFGTRFKLLSAGAGSKHGDLCNEQIRDSNERSNLSCGFCSPKPKARRAPLLPKNSSAGTSGANSVGFLPLFSKGGGVFSGYFLEVDCIIKPSFSGVVCPVDKRHKSMAKRRAA